MLGGRTLMTLMPLISAGCVGFRRFVGRICENLRQICGICVPLCQTIPRFTNNNVLVLPFACPPFVLFVLFVQIRGHSWTFVDS